MKTITSLALTFLTCGVGWAQSGFSGTYGSISDIEITFKCQIEPPGSNGWSGQVGALALRDKDKLVGMRRYATDSKAHEYFGYDMKVEPIDGSAGMYRVTFSALTLTPDEIKLPDPKNWRLLPAPVFPPPQTVSTMDTIALDLFENPATGQKLVDYIRLEPSGCDPVNSGPGQLKCLSGLVQAARRSLKNKVTELEGARDPATANSIRTSQLTWEKYRDDACAKLADELKRLQCELKLTQSRAQDLVSLYGS